MKRNHSCVNLCICVCVSCMDVCVSAHVVIGLMNRVFANGPGDRGSRGARGVIDIVVGSGHGDTSSNLDETDCISHCTNTLGKGMNPIILPPAMGK